MAPACLPVRFRDATPLRIAGRHRTDRIPRGVRVVCHGRLGYGLRLTFAVGRARSIATLGIATASMNPSVER